MILTKTRLRAVVELMEGEAPEGFAEMAMADYGPGSTWALGDKAKCPPDTWCEHCEVEHCNMSAPPLFELLARDYFSAKGYDVVWRERPPLGDDYEIPF